MGQTRRAGRRRLDGRRRPAVRRILSGVLLVALAAGIYGVLPRLGGPGTPRPSETRATVKC